MLLVAIEFMVLVLFLEMPDFIWSCLGFLEVALVVPGAAGCLEWALGSMDADF